MDDTRNWEPAVRGGIESREADAFYEKPCSGKTRHLYRQTTTVKTAASKEWDDTKDCVTGCLRWRRKTHTKCCFPAEKSSKESINKNYNNKERSDEKET